jgi:ribonuclease P protein component
MDSANEAHPRVERMCLKHGVEKDGTYLLLKYHVLRRNRRISGRQRIQSVLKEGDRLKGRSIVMLKKANDKEWNCYGVVVSKKVHKSAVRRNRVRRRIYESIRLLEKDGLVPSDPPSDIVLLARSSILEKDFAEIQSALKQLFTQSND